MPFSGGSFAYEVSAPSEIYLDGTLLSASSPGETVRISFTSGNVTAFGANFFATDDVNAFQAVSITLTLSDGTSQTFTPTSAADSYRGFVSSGSAFSSIAIATSGAQYYTSLDNLTVGAAPVPEPSSLGLLAVGLAGLGGFVARRRAA